uniref:Synaptotagmin binding cytoplasmic RNA interacting protein n=1 Tax=Corvus moneduloides TaxID=1196302 RepID=A0A8C3DQL0_CORMO
MEGRERARGGNGGEGGRARAGGARRYNPCEAARETPGFGAAPARAAAPPPPPPPLLFPLPPLRSRPPSARPPPPRGVEGAGAGASSSSSGVSARAAAILRQLQQQHCPDTPPRERGTGAAPQHAEPRPAPRETLRTRRFSPRRHTQISGNMATEHVNGNGTEEPMDTSAAVTHSEHFQTLLDAGLPQKVAEKLDEIYVAGLVAHSDLDERAIEALKEFNEEGALAVLQQFKDSDLSHVQNKSAFLCGVMKTYRQREKQGTKVADSSKGPDEAKIKALLERTGYTLDVTTGQRKYGGPPPESVYSGQQPSVGTEIFVGKIPRDLFEDELVPLFEKAGPIWDLRLMMDPLTGLNRGYAFVTFCTKEAAQEAVKLYNNHEIRSGKHIGVCISVANNRLFVGSIPKSKTKEQIVEEFSKVTEGLTDVILYHQPDDKKKNRGFCFLEYEDHKTAAQARRRLMSGKVKVWGNVVTVEWADPIEDPDPEVMAKVKVLFVRNLANTVTEEILEKAFSQFGKLERVKKLKDYAFIHFDERDGAVKAMEEMNGKDLEGENIEIVFAKPPDQKRKERKAQRQAAKNQMYDDYYYYGPPHMPPPTRGRGRGGRGGYGYPPDYYGYEDYYDYYGYDYHNYRGGYEDPYYGYEDFQVGARGRGGRGARGAAPSRGRGAAPPRGRAGYAQRGGPGSARGVRGARGGAQQQRGRGQGKGVEAGPDLLQ